MLYILLDQNYCHRVQNDHLRNHFDLTFSLLFVDAFIVWAWDSVVSCGKFWCEWSTSSTFSLKFECLVMTQVYFRFLKIACSIDVNSLPYSYSSFSSNRYIREWNSSATWCRRARYSPLSVMFYSLKAIRND